MALSIVIPAFNEAKLIEATVGAARRAAGVLGEDHEVIVVDDASTDATAERAEAAGARVIEVHCRQIAATRNAGAHQSSGDWLLFLDADTLIRPATLGAAQRALANGFVGGGATVTFESAAQLRSQFAARIWNFIARTKRWAAGSFVFCRRDAFDAVGGFDQRYFASEEVHLSKALHRHAGRERFAIVGPPVITSSRKDRLYATADQWRALRQAILSRGRSLRQREGLELWYDGRR